MTVTIIANDKSNPAGKLADTDCTLPTARLRGSS